MRILLTWIGLALASVATTGPATAQDTPLIRNVGAIVIEGNRRIEEATVRSYLVVREGAPASPEQINTSVRRLYDTGLFRDVQITPQGGTLVVQVAENPSINRVAFEGNEDIEEEDLLGAIQSAPRRAFSRALAEQDSLAIIQLYQRTGRYDVKVDPQIVERDENRVDLIFVISEGGRNGVRSIDFVGNQAFSDRRLRGVIDTSESGILAFLTSSDVYDPDRLELDKELLRRYYLDRGYADFTVLSATAELGPDRQDFFITFTIEEGPVYSFGDLTVISPFEDVTEEELLAVLPMESGDLYRARDVSEAIDNMAFLAGQKGYAFVDINPRANRDPETQTIGIEFRLQEAPRVFVERIEIEGNTRTIDRVLRREFNLAEGDPFNIRDVREARERLIGLGFFSSVDVTTERGSADDRAIIRVRVTERLTGSIAFGVGFSSADGAVGDISVSERNFLGRGQALQVRVGVSGDRQVFDFRFREPRLLDRDLSAGFSIYYREEDRSDASSFEETNIGFEPGVSFPIAEDLDLRLRYRISQDEIRDVRSTASPAIAADAGSRLTSSIGGRLVYDKRNDPNQPTGGYLLSFDQEFAGLGGDSIYARSVGSAKAWTSFLDEDVIASIEVEAGGIVAFNDDLRVTDRFFLGGDRFRGFESGGLGPRDLNTDDSLGGKYYAVMRAETSFPLGLPEELGFFGGLFADVGTVFGLDQTTFGTTVIDDSAKLRATVGASLFYESPFGPLRFNVAYPLLSEAGDKREFFRFTIGTRF